MTSSGRRQVLVVDDEAGMRLVLGRALARAGFEVLLADTAAAGITALAESPELDAVIVDVTMPSAVGLEFAAAVIADHPAVPLLFLTGGPTATGALDDPMIGLVPKPVRMGTLLARLGELIDRAATLTAAGEVSSAEHGPVGPGRGPLIGVPHRRVAPAARLDILPELDHSTATWAAVAGLAGLTGGIHDAGPGRESAVPEESTRLARLGLFAAGVANEVNNMLAVVSMRADLIAVGEDGRPPTPAVAEDLDAITAAAARASELVQQLMLFAGQRTVDRGPVDLAQLAADFQSRLDEVAGGRGVVAVTTEAVPAVTGDHEHLERVLLNLVRNALEATAPTHPGAGTAVAPARVRIRVGPAPSGEPAGVVIEVADNGRGMTDDVADRAVEPFFRAYTSAGGAGLGLSTVHGIITQHGGRLEIDSNPASGTTVRVTLPAASRLSTTP